MLAAVKRMPTKAMSTDSGSAPPAKAAPRGIEAAMAAPGAIDVIDWKSAAMSPTWLRASCGAVVVSLISCPVVRSFSGPVVERDPPSAPARGQRKTDSF